MDVVDLEADLQAAENVAQRAMNRPQEEIGGGGGSGSAAAGAPGAFGAKTMMGAAAAAVAANGGNGANGNGANGNGNGLPAGGVTNATNMLYSRGPNGELIEEEVTTETTVEVVAMVPGGANPLDRPVLPNSLASPAPAPRMSGAPRRASLLAPLGSPSPLPQVEESMLMSDIVRGIEAPKPVL